MNEFIIFLYVSKVPLIFALDKNIAGTSQVVQWLRLHASTAGSTGSIPGWGTKIPHAACMAKKNQKTNKQNIGLKNVVYSVVT